MQRQSPASITSEIYRASIDGNVDALRALVQQGINITDTFFLPGTETTPLFAAAERGHEEVVNLLISEGAPVNTAGMAGVGRTPLHIAAWNKHTNIVKALLNAGADCNQYDIQDKFTSLHFAALSGDINVVKAILEAFPDAYARCSNGGTPLDFAGRNEEMIVLLKKRRAEQDLLAAATNGDLAAIQDYITKNPGANLDAFRVAKNDATLLLSAIHANHPDIVTALLAAGANPDTDATYPHTKNKLTSLGLALKCKYVDICKMLINAGADVNATFNIDDISYTPLQYAMSNDHHEIALLIRQKQTPKFEERLNAVYDGPIPDDYCCPIRHTIMCDPITVTSGITFERQALADWFKAHDNPDRLLCPKNRETYIYLRELDNNPSIIVRNLIDRFVCAKEQRARTPGNNTGGARLFSQQAGEGETPVKRSRRRAPQK